MWYSFDYGLAHFISIDGETDFANSPEYPFARDLSKGETRPKRNETYVTDSGPFGTVGNYTDTKTYAQYQWLEKDLAAVDRTKTPWVIAMTHRPMYSSEVSSYQKNIRAAFQGLLLEYEADVYLSGHIHWYERLFPMTGAGLVDTASIINNNTYYTNPGKSMTHIINGAAGNIESHSTLAAGASPLNITAVLDQEHFGFLKLKVFNCSALSISYIEGNDGSTRDVLTLLKKDGSCPGNWIWFRLQLFQLHLIDSCHYRYLLSQRYWYRLIVKQHCNCRQWGCHLYHRDRHFVHHLLPCCYHSHPRFSYLHRN